MSWKTAEQSPGETEVQSPIPETEKAERFEYLEHTREVFREFFASKPETFASVDTALNILDRAERKHPDVAYHGILHVLGMARSALRTVLYLDGAVEPKKELPLEAGEAEELKKLRSELQKLEKTLTVAAILHDMGYYEPDPNFGTMRVDHETRSQAFFEKNAKALGLAHEEVAAAKAMIEATRFQTPLMNIHEILNPKSEQIIPDQYCKILRLPSRTAMKEASARDKAVLLCASMLGALDIMGADRHYIRNVALGLRHEFNLDVQALDKSAEEKPEKKSDADKEKARIPLQTSGRTQVIKTSFFYKFAVPRVLSTGFVSADGDNLTEGQCLFDHKTIATAIRNQRKIFGIENDDPEDIDDLP